MSNYFFSLLILLVNLNWERHYYQQCSISVEFPNKIKKNFPEVEKDRDISVIDSNANVFLDIKKIEWSLDECTTFKDSIKQCFKEYFHECLRRTTSSNKSLNKIKSNKIITYKGLLGIQTKTIYCFNKWRIYKHEYRSFIYKNHFILLGFECIKDKIKNYEDKKDYYFNSLQFY